MNSRFLRLAFLLFSSTRSAFAQSSLEPDLAPGGVGFDAQAHFGVTTTPFDVSSLHQASGHGFVFVGGGRVAVTQRLCLALQVPFVLGSVAQPAGSYVDAIALGNPQLGAEWRSMPWRTGASALALAGGMEIGAPIASHGSDLMPNRVLALADGIEGRSEPERFTPGVVPVTAASRLLWATPPWSVELELRLPLLLRVSRADLPSTTRTRDLGFSTVVSAEARYRFSQGLSLGAATEWWLDVAPVVGHVRRVSPVQDLERLSAYIHLAPSAALIVELQAAIGGELGGSTVGGGLRLRVDLDRARPGLPLGPGPTLTSTQRRD